MRPRVQGATVLITGASSGIGRAMAVEFARSGAAKLIVVARRLERLEELGRELEAAYAQLEVFACACDLSDSAAIEALVERVETEHEGVDILVNNAGLGDVDFFSEAAWPKLRLMIRVNCEALVELTHRLLPGMIARGRGGGVLNISSGFGWIWMPGMATYAASKYFVTAFSEGLRVELRGEGLSVTQINPGPVATEFNAVAADGGSLEVPGFMVVSAQTCARVSVRAFAKGRAAHVPGFVPWLMISLGRMSPAWLLRLSYRLVLPILRKELSGKGAHGKG